MHLSEQLFLIFQISISIFFIWQILFASVSTDYKVDIFLNVTTLFDQMQQVNYV